MWPFKKKVEKEDLNLGEKALEEFKKFKAKGERFKYLGVEMIVCCYGFWGRYYPRLEANYINNQGDIKTVYFEYYELDNLKKENLP